MKITYIHNKGTDDIPFGFVYFNDGTRVVFASDYDTRIYSGPPHIEQPKDDHVEMANKKLSEEFPNVIFRG